jgi:N-acetylneuraminic acid mutarotase
MSFRPSVFAVLLAVLPFAACRDDDSPVGPQPGPATPETAGLGAAAAGGDLADAVTGSWAARAPLPSPRADLAAVTLTDAAGAGRFYALGGINANGAILPTVNAWNPATNAWTTRAPLPTRLYRSNGAGAIGGKIYLTGGLTIRRLVLAQLQIYDAAANAWTTRPMPRAGFDGVTGVIGNRLYVLTSCGAGGECDQSYDRAFYRYTPSTGSWLKLASPPHPHRQAVAGVIGGRLYVAGDNAEGGRFLDVYDPGTNGWTTRAQLPRARWAAAGAVLDGRLYLIGGFAGAPGTTAAVATTSIYDPATNTWSHTTPLPTARTGVAADKIGSGTGARIELVGGAGANHLEFTASASGQLRWDTIPLPSGVLASIRLDNGKSVWGSSSSDLYVVGRAQSGAGVIIHYDGSGWTRRATLTDTTVVAISGSSPTDVWAVGNTLAGRPSVVLHFNGTRWVRSTGPASTAFATEFHDIVAVRSGPVLLSGQVRHTSAPTDTLTELVGRNTGSGWSEMPTPGFGYIAELTGIAASGSGEIWATGQHLKSCDDCQNPVPILVHYDGTSWTMRENVAYKLNGVAAVGAHEAWIAGQDDDVAGLMVHWKDGTVTAAFPTDPAPPGLTDVWGSGPGDVYAVGPQVLLHFDGTRWTTIPGVTGNKIWGLSSHDVYVLQGTRLIHGRI